MWRLLLAVLAAVTLHGQALGHARSESYSNWRVDEPSVVGTVTVTAGEITSLVELGNSTAIEDLFIEHLRATVSAMDGAERCALAAAEPLKAPRGFVRVELRFTCAALSSVHYRALFDVQPSHVHFARFFANGELVSETVLTDRADTWLNTADQARQSLTDFLDLGIRHILSGVDHIAFLLGLLLVAGSPARSVAAVTGFTLGHSVSLAAAVLGYVRADGRLVEAFIGFTVALVAIEFFQRHSTSRMGLSIAMLLTCALTAGVAVTLNLLPASAMLTYLGFGLFAYCYLQATTHVATNAMSWRGLLVATTCFGLVHGFGFAGFLMDTGVSGDSLLLPLLGFNLGVEAGQLALLVVFMGAAALLGGRLIARLSPAVASALCAVGCYWFVGRSLGV